MKATGRTHIPKTSHKQDQCNNTLSIIIKNCIKKLRSWHRCAKQTAKYMHAPLCRKLTNIVNNNAQIDNNNKRNVPSRRQSDQCTSSKAHMKSQ